MSRLIDQLRASDYPDKSARDLTLEYGQWLKANNRDDIFMANPDFAQEFADLTDELDRAQRPSYVGEFKGAFGSAVDQLQASGFALGALAAHGAKALGIPGAEPIRNNLLRLMNEQQDEANSFQPSVPSYEKISGAHPIEDTARYLTYGAGTVAPSMAQAVVSGIAGAAVGSAIGPEGTVGGAFAGLAERKLAQKILSAALEKGTEGMTLEFAAKQLTKKEIADEAKRLAVEYGGQAALMASSIGQEVGSIYADAPDAPLPAIGYGIPAGLLDVLPESYVLSRFFGHGAKVGEEAAKGAMAYFKRFAAEAAKTVPMEGSTEAAQTLLEIAAAKSARGESPASFTADDYKNALNAGIIGAIGGLGMAPVAAAGNPGARINPADAVAARVGDVFNVETRNAQLDEQSAVIGENPEFVSPEVNDAIEAARTSREVAANDIPNARLGSEAFTAADQAPYAGLESTGQPTGAPTALPVMNLPSAVRKAVERADELAARWGGVQISTIPEPPAAVSPADEITDAPLANLIGTQVEYQGYRGTLVRDREGNFMVLPPVSQGGKPFWIEVAGTSKNPETMATAVALTPLEPANMTPKPAPAVTIPGIPAGRAPGELSKVPLGDLFPSDLVPRPDLNPQVATQPGTVLAAAGVQPAPVAPNLQSVAPNAVQIESPNALPLRNEPVSSQGVRVENVVPPVEVTPGAREVASVVAAPGAGAAPEVAASLVAPQSTKLKPIPSGTTFLYEQGGNRYYQIPDAESARGSRTVDVQTLAREDYDIRGLPQPIATMPTGAQAAAASGNGVPALPADTAPNLRRLRIFEHPKAEPATADELGPLPEIARTKPTVESQSLQENPLVALDKAVGKLGKAESNVAVVIVDNNTGLAYIRGAYRGAANTLYVDMASSRKGTATGKGSTVSAEADFNRGTEGRPAQKLFAEKTAAGLPRYTVYGVGELTKAGKLNNWNVGSAANLNTHPAIQAAAKRWWSDTAAVRTTGKAVMPKANADIAEFPVDMAAWRRDNPGATAATAMKARITEYANAQNKAFGGILTAAKLEAWVQNLHENIETMARIERKQAILLSADYLVAPTSAIDVMQSTLRALTQETNVEVAAFEQSAMGSVNAASQTTGFVLNQDAGRKIVAFGLASITGPVNTDTVISVLHEGAHVVTDGLPEPLRVAFQEAVEMMPWQQAGWLMNPRSLDIRLLANSLPEQLSPEQREALGRLSAEEIAAARRMDPAELVGEKMAEHLAQLGWDKSEAKTAVQKFIRFVKEIWFRLAMAVQTTFKGADQISPALARAYVENRFLQFIHRDSALATDRINDLKNWLGVPATERQLIPVFPAGNDWDMRMQYVDIVSGRLIPVDQATFTPEAQTFYLGQAIANATRFVRDNPNPTDTPDFRQTRRAAFSAPQSFTPTLQTNTVFAALNLEDEIYKQIAAREDIAPLLPPGANFYADWLRLPDKQLPAVRSMEAETWAKATKDPLTNAPVTYNAAIRVDDLPSTEEPIVDKENKPIVVKLTEAQDKALQQTIAALNDTQSRVQRRINYEADRITDLERIRKKNPADFPTAALAELENLYESFPLRQKIAAQLETQRKRLLSKFAPADMVNVFPTAEYPTIPGPTATEAQIMAAPRGVVPRDYKFTDKSVLAGHLSAMDAWLRVPENQQKGQIYGTMAEWYRKLNQIPTDLEIAGTAAVFRRAVTGGFGDELRHGGLRALQLLGRKIFEVADVVNTHNERMAKAGATWGTAFNDFAKALGENPDQAFKERVWDPLMRTWNFIDVSERNRLGTVGEGDLFTTMEKALKNAAGVEINSEPKRAALRALLMQTIESERQIRTIYEQYPALKVHDEVMGTYRRLVSHGLVTGRRGVARHITGLFMRMNAEWSDTAPVGANAAEDQRTFWEAAGDLYKSDRAAFDKRMGELFEGYTINDFVEPLINNNTQIFTVTDADGVAHKASLLRVRQAWSEAAGNITTFAERLHALEGGAPDAEGQTVTSVLGAFRSMFEEIKADQDSKNGAEALGHEILPRQMMDARIANDWPAEWVSYATYGTADNLGLLHQLARSVAFGQDPISGSGELATTIREAKKDLAEMYAVFDDHYRNGKSLKEIEQLMGSDEFRVAQNSDKIVSNLNKVEAAFRQMSSHTNYLAGDFRLLNDTLGLMAANMVGNPRGAGINLIGDLLGPLVALKLSRPALRAAGAQIRAVLADAGNSVIQAFGQDSAWNIEAAKRRMAAGTMDSDNYISWREKMNNLGPGLTQAAPAGYEASGAKLRRNLGRFAAQARNIVPNLGSPFQKSTAEATLSPKLRWSAFGTSAMMTMNANIDAAYQVFNDLAVRGVDYIKKLPVTQRAQFVRELELGVRNLDAQQLGYYGGLILNDKAAFESLQNALETKMAGEKGVGDFVAKAYRRAEAAGGQPWESISTSQFTGIINYANTEWTLQSNFASLPPWMQSGPLRPLFIFLTWPYNAMRRFGKSFVDAQGRIGRGENGKIAWWGENSTIADGMKAFFVLSAPATIAGSFAIDWYDKYLQGKRQNLREASALTAIPLIGPVMDPAAFVERIGRYGSAGLATDVINQIVNYDSQRNLSLDNRIVAINAIHSAINSLVSTPIAQGGNITYASVGRPFFQSIGGSGVLQYLQIMQNVLGLNTQDAAINARINTGNYLRAAGRTLDLPVAVMTGQQFVPTPITPYLQQMELGALVNNTDLFRGAYQNAVQAARDAGQADPEKYIADNFAERHPLKRLFKGAVSETDYRRMLGQMGDYGAGQVRAAINSYNRYLTNWFGRKGYYGKADSSGQTVEQLIREASKINSDMDREANSLLAIP